MTHSAFANEDRWTPRLIVSFLSILLVLEILNTSYLLMSTALPSVSAHYHTSQGAWLLTAFTLVGSVSSPLIGKLADLRGKRETLLWCLVLSAFGTLLSAVAPNYALMLVGRALAGLLVPVLFLSYSLIRDVFPPSKVAIAVSIVTTGSGLVLIFAPFLAGWLLDTWSFRAIFWFIVIAIAVLAPAIAVSTPESPVRLKSRLDIRGALLLSSGLSLVLVAVSVGPGWGWLDLGTLGFFFGGVILLAAWARSALHTTAPLVDLNLFRHRAITLTGIAAGLAYACSSAFTMLLPMMLMTPAGLELGYGFGLSASAYAFYQAPTGLFTMVGGLIVGFTIKRVRARTMFATGNVLMLIAFIGTAFWHTGTPGLIVFASFMGLGMGLCYASIPNIIIASIAPQLQATTASVVTVVQSALAGLLPVVAQAVLNSNVATVVEGSVFYTDTGMTLALLAGAVTALIGISVSLAIPRRVVRFKGAVELAEEQSKAEFV